MTLHAKMREDRYALQQGSIRTEDRLVSEVADDLNTALRMLGLVPDEYGMTVSPPHKDPAARWTQRGWTACFAVTGGSEGWYVHVESIDTRQGTRELLLLGKCWSFDLALDVARACSWLLEGV